MKARTSLAIMFLGMAVVLGGFPRSESAQAPNPAIANRHLDQARLSAIRQLLRQQVMSAKADDLHKLAPGGQALAPFRTRPGETLPKPVAKPKDRKSVV